MAEEYSIMYVSIFIYHIFLFFILCLGWTFGLTSLILAIVTSSTKNHMVHQSFQVSAFIFFPDIYLEGELLGLYLIFSEPPYSSTLHASSYIPTNYTQEIQFFHILVNTCSFLFF